MRRTFVLVAVLLLSCESPLEEPSPSPLPTEDAQVDAEPEVEVVPEVEEETSVAVEEVPDSIRAVDAVPRLGSNVTRSSRFVGHRRSSAVQQAETFHSHRFPRRMTESRIIRTDPSIEDHERLIDLTVLVLARIGVSEANWKATPWEDADGTTDPIGELPRLFQVMRTQRRPGETFINTMRNFSRIVSEMWAPSRARERWLTELDLEGSYPPSFTEDERSWRQLYRDRWLEVVSLARDLLFGRVNGTPCAAPLLAWGGRCDVSEGACDDPIARRRGLVPVETCGGENRYWARPQRMPMSTVLAEIALAQREGRDPEPLLVARIEDASLLTDLAGRLLEIE